MAQGRDCSQTLDFNVGVICILGFWSPKVYPPPPPPPATGSCQEGGGGGFRASLGYVGNPKKELREA